MSTSKPRGGRAVAVTRNLLKHRRRFLACLVLGVLAGVFVPVPMSPVARVLVGWNVFQWGALAGLLRLMVGATPEKIRHTAVAFDESDEFVLGLVSLASLGAVGCLFFEMISGRHVEGFRLVEHMVLSLGTLSGLWLLVPMAFALTYTHDWYEAPADRKPVRFPDDVKSPDYWDFVYFSITIAVACQTADVSLTSRRARRLVLAQSLLAFVFNTSVIGLTINLAAGVLS